MSGDKGISAFPDGDNLFRWKGTIHGGEGTVSVFFSSFWLVYILGCVALNVKNQYRTIKLEMIFWGGHVS